MFGRGSEDVTRMGLADFYAWRAALLDWVATEHPDKLDWALERVAGLQIVLGTAPPPDRWCPNDRIPEPAWLSLPRRCPDHGPPLRASPTVSLTDRPPHGPPVAPALHFAPRVRQAA
jgi:hypothetical protein